MLVSIKKIIDDAYKNEYAIGAYNINNLEWTKWILQACEEDKSPVILEVTPSAVNYMGGFDVVINMVKSMIKDLDITVDVALHLDHAKDFLTCKKAIDAGFKSVMIDASDKPFEENVNIVNEVVKYAKQNNAFVESELGSIDGGCCSYDESGVFVLDTGIDFFAPAVGNKHGIYNGDEEINFELLGAISKQVKLPLVLHGASGIDDNKIKTAIFCGVCKININTDLQIAWANEVRKYLDFKNNEHDPRLIIGSGKDAIKTVVHKKNTLFGSINKNKAN